MAKIVLDPITRIEGHLRIETRIAQGKVVEAWSMGEMFRGFEALLQGRDPLDAPVITQRICGVCPVSHAIASCRAIESALNLTVPANGRYLRNLILGANFLQSHILHFYHLSALDFVQVEALLEQTTDDPVLKELQAWARNETLSNRVLPAAPLLPKLPGDYAADPAWNLNAIRHYVEALDIRQETHRMAALLGGKMPHAATIVPGGVTCDTGPQVLENFRTRLRRVQRFINNTYLPDVLQVARLFPQYAGEGQGVGRFLSYGVFDEQRSNWLPSGVLMDGTLRPLDTDLISETTASSYYRDSTPAHPSKGRLEPAPDKQGAYSWLKAPVYDGHCLEVGPLARLLVAEAAGNAEVAGTLRDFLTETGLSRKHLVSTLGRHAARAIETALVAQRMEHWLDALQTGQTGVGPYERKTQGQGEGLIEAPRGALGHWVSISSNRIERYQCVVPSTWNFSPRATAEEPGPVEAALAGVKINPEYRGIEVARTVRAFDPCIACAVH